MLIPIITDVTILYKKYRPYTKGIISGPSFKHLLPTSYFQGILMSVTSTCSPHTHPLQQ